MSAFKSVVFSFLGISTIAVLMQCINAEPDNQQIIMAVKMVDEMRDFASYNVSSNIAFVHRGSLVCAKINYLITDGAEDIFTKDDMLRALYEYMLSEPKPPRDYDGFSRESRSGKPTFIRFGKRTPSLVANAEVN